MPHPYLAPMLFVTFLWIGMIYMNEKYALFSVDRFSSDVTKWIAYIWLGAFLLMLTFLIIGSSLHPPTPKDLAAQAAGPVDLEFGPDGDLYYVALNIGQIRRISFRGG